MARSIRVLHVDDDPDFTSLVSEYLSRENDRIDVETATGAGEALDRLDDAEFDCIVSDYDMPEMNGIAFLERVREAYPDLPFILYTGKGSEEVASEAISAGVTDYLQKETGTDQYAILANRIENAVERYAAQREVDWHETVLDNMDEGVYVLDGDCRFQFVNYRVEDDALTTEEWENRPLSYLADSGALSEREIEWIRAGAETLFDGEADEVRIEIEPAVPDATDTVEAALGRADRESELRAQHRELQRQNERLDEFASVVSHDLRNPLQVLEGSLDQAAETGDEAHFERARNAVDRMNRLVSDLLVLAREGESITTTEPVDLAALAEGCWTNVETDGARLVVDTDATVEADRNRLKQLLENLFRNAVEHGSTSPDSQARRDAVEHGIPDDHAAMTPADAGGHTPEGLTVTVGDLDDAQGFFVADDGPGIPPAEREAVFETGYSTSGEGTGFGLSIVESVAEAHGWDVHLTDSENSGARFEFVVA